MKYTGVLEMTSPLLVPSDPAATAIPTGRPSSRDVSVYCSVPPPFFGGAAPEVTKAP